MTRLLLFSRDVNLQRGLGSAITEITVLVESNKSRLLDAHYFTVEEQVTMLGAIRNTALIITTDDATRPTALKMEPTDVAKTAVNI